MRAFILTVIYFLGTLGTFLLAIYKAHTSGSIPFSLTDQTFYESTLMTLLYPLLGFSSAILWGILIWMFTRSKYVWLLLLVGMAFVSMSYIILDTNGRLSRYTERNARYVGALISTPVTHMQSMRNLISPHRDVVEHAVDFETADAGETYTVSSGDTLWEISRSFYDDPFIWRTIFQANSEDISFLENGHPLIVPDQPLNIPLENLTYDQFSPGTLYSLLEIHGYDHVRILGTDGPRVYLKAFNRTDQIFTLFQFDLFDGRNMEIVDTLSLPEIDSLEQYSAQLVRPDLLLHYFSLPLKVTHIDTETKAFKTLPVHFENTGRYQPRQIMAAAVSDSFIASVVMMGEDNSFNNPLYKVVVHTYDRDHVELVGEFGFITPSGLDINKIRLTDTFNVSFLDENTILFADSDIGIWGLDIVALADGSYRLKKNRILQDTDCIFTSLAQMHRNVAALCAHHPNRITVASTLQPIDNYSLYVFSKEADDLYIGHTDLPLAFEYWHFNTAGNSQYPTISLIGPRQELFGIRTQEQTIDFQHVRLENFPDAQVVPYTPHFFFIVSGNTVYGYKID